MKTEREIIYSAVRKNAQRDYQEAQNAAYETALEEGYSEDDASDLAHAAGIAHAANERGELDEHMETAYPA